MTAIAVVDAQLDSDLIAVWITKRAAGTMVEHTNAVVIQRDDPEADTKLDALLTERIVLLTDKSHYTTDRPVLTMAALDRLQDETLALHGDIKVAVRKYAAQTRNKNLTVPDEPAARTPETPAANTAQTRALAAANHLRRVWRDWLDMEQERQRRTVSPRTKESPWMMPSGLDMTTMRDLPSALTSSFTQPVSE